MNILFDLISIQNYHSGGGEYVKLVYLELSKLDSINIVGLYDSRQSFLGEDPLLFNNSSLVDIRSYSICDIVSSQNIDVVFIGIAQRYNGYDLKNINCKVVAVMHDIGDIEIAYNKIHYLYRKSLKNYIRLSFDYLFEWTKYSTINRTYRRYHNIIKLLSSRNTTMITVSNYTLHSIAYFFPILANKSIKVYYPPTKKYVVDNDINNSDVRFLISNKVKYLLFLNANRDNKNFDLLYKCFMKLRNTIFDIKLVVTGLSSSKNSSEIIFLEFVTDSDIEHLYRNAWALVYASYTEGFGYPPIEAIKYGIPVLSSNVCSMPEILADSVVYFSPFYENDLFNKITYLFYNYAEIKCKFTERYLEIKKMQQDDLKSLINEITNAI